MRNLDTYTSQKSSHSWTDDQTETPAGAHLFQVVKDSNLKEMNLTFLEHCYIHTDVITSKA